MRKLAFLGSTFTALGALAAFAVACGDDASTAPLADAAAEAAPDGAPGSGDGATPPPASGPCLATELCFDVTPLRPGTTPLSGRIMLWWYQLDDDGPDPPMKLGYSAPFDGTSARVRIPLADVLPADEVHAICDRDCEDETICPCLGGPKPAVGIVAVFADADAGGETPTLGVAQMAVAYSDQEVKPSPPSYSGKFPDGIEQGVRGYKLVRPDGGGFDNLGYAPPGTVFELPVCDTTDEDLCDPKGPNLT